MHNCKQCVHLLFEDFSSVCYFLSHIWIPASNLLFCVFDTEYTWKPGNNKGSMGGHLKGREDGRKHMMKIEREDTGVGKV